MQELSPQIYRQVQDLCRKGDQLCEEENFEDALEQFDAAWALLPEPRNEWEVSHWILTAMADAEFLSGDYENGRESVLAALQCPGGGENPFLNLRLGQCELELGELEAAAPELIKAYRTGGQGLFEDEDPKYLEFVKRRLNPGPKRPPKSGPRRR
jgi:tetratricopeptide (TPR) repeat protein